MTKLERMHNRLNDDFPKVLAKAFWDKFDTPIETTFDIFGTMRMISRRMDGEEFTPDQFAWIEYYSQGYSDAMRMVKTESRT
mgnify:CR=1 FL=1